MVDRLRYYDETRNFSVLSGASFANQNSNIVLAGPSSGPSAPPAFRSIVSSDLPQPLSAANIPSGVISQSTGGNPTATSSLTFVMMGLGSSFTITPTFYTRVHATVTCQIANSAASDIAIARLRFGTGAAPANGVAETGTGFGQLQSILNNANAAGLGVPCTLVGIMTSLTPNTTYWIDVSLESVTGGTSSIINTQLTAFEFP